MRAEKAIDLAIPTATGALVRTEGTTDYYAIYYAILSRVTTHDATWDATHVTFTDLFKRLVL